MIFILGFGVIFISITHIIHIIWGWTVPLNCSFVKRLVYSKMFRNCWIWIQHFLVNTAVYQRARLVSGYWTREKHYALKLSEYLWFMNCYPTYLFIYRVAMEIIKHLTHPDELYALIKYKMCGYQNSPLSKV